jgi:hypothetical protein
MLGRRCFARTGVHSTIGCCMDLGPARTRPTFMPSQCSANVRKWPFADPNRANRNVWSLG